MNKRQRHSIDGIKAQVVFILRMAELERKRLSFTRKRKIETSYSSLVLHASKLGLHVLTPGTWYESEEYARNCQDMLAQLKLRYEQA